MFHSLIPKMLDWGNQIGYQGRKALSNHMLEVRCWFGVAINIFFLLRNIKLFLYILKENVLHSGCPVHSYSSTQLFYFAWTQITIYQYPATAQGNIFLRAQKLIKSWELLPRQSFAASVGAAVHSFKCILCSTQHCFFSPSEVFSHGEVFGQSGCCPEAAQVLLPAFLCRNWSSAFTEGVYSNNALLPLVTTCWKPKD